MGAKVSIDDFGTGYSSLAYRQNLPVDQIKVDQSFVANLATIPGDAVIFRSTIDIAHNLGLTVVAEGVEDENTLDSLAQYGCDSAQGYLFSRALTAEELTPWLTESPFGALRTTALYSWPSHAGYAASAASVSGRSIRSQKALTTSG